MLKLGLGAYSRGRRFGDRDFSHEALGLRYNAENPMQYMFETPCSQSATYSY